MAEECDMNEVLQNEEGDDPYKGDQNGQPFILLLRVVLANGKPLPIGGFTARAMSQMSHEIAGVVPKEVIMMNDQEVVMELDEEMSLMDVSRAVHGLFHWGWQSVSVDSLVAKRDLVTEIVKEQEIGREKQKELEQEHHRMREDKQDHQQQMIEILEKVSDQIKKVENMHSRSVPALEGEYYTPPASEIRVNTSSKLSGPPNLPIFLGQ